MNSRATASALAPAIIAPLLFGLGATAPKALLADIPPLMLAGILYLASGLGLGTVWLLRPRASTMAGELVGHGIEVTAIHNHMVTETPRIVFLHFWGVGKAEDLAKGLWTALDKTGGSEKAKP